MSVDGGKEEIILAVVILFETAASLVCISFSCIITILPEGSIRCKGKRGFGLVDGVSR